MVQIRNYNDNDFHDVLRLGNDLDIHGQIESEDDLRTSLSLQRNVPEKDIFMVLDGEKTVGYARVNRNRDLKVNRHNTAIFLDPAFHGDKELFDELIRLSETRIREISREYGDMPLTLKTWCYDEEKWFAEGAERNGYKLARYFARMDLHDLTQLPDPEVPPGVTLRVFDRAKEAEAFVDAFNRGFEGHYEFYPETVENFGEYFDTHWYQPENVFVAEYGGELVGVCIGYHNPEPEADGLNWGIIEDLAVVPEWRGKGLGRALIRNGHKILKERGLQKICLWMDYANPFGAKKLYYSEGYVDRYISLSFKKEG